MRKIVPLSLSIWLGIQTLVSPFCLDTVRAAITEAQPYTMADTDFGGKYHADGTLDSITFALPPNVKDKNPKDLAMSVIINGVDYSGNASYDSASSEITITNIQGEEVKVLGYEYKDPGYFIWRESDNLTWEIEGNGTGKFIYQPNNVSNGESPDPGSIPTSAYNVTHGQTEPIPDTLQNNGEAVANYHQLTPPTKFYVEEAGQTIDPQYPDGAELVTSDKVVMNNQSPSGGNDFLTIDKVVPDPKYPLDIISSGPGLSAGTGTVKVGESLILDSNQSLDLTYKRLTDSNNDRLGLLYYMYFGTYWRSVTYRYQGSIMFTYETTPPIKPDLFPLNIELTSGVLEAGTTANFSATFTNSGPDIAQSFHISIYDGLTVIAATDYGGLAQNATGTFNFSATLNDTQTHTFTIILDESDVVDENSESNNSLSTDFTPQAAGTSEIKGTFTISPTTINWRDSFTLTPVGIDAGANCEYLYHKYRFTNGNSVEGDNVNSETQTSNYTYSNYPSSIAPGNNTVEMDIVTSCGESGWKDPQTLVVNPSIPDNHPPQFQVGWVYPYDTKHPLNYVLTGTTLNLMLISDPSVPTPTDPDGDWVEFQGFDPNTADPWTRNAIASRPEYNVGYTNILMDTPGVFSITGYMKDRFGAVSQATASIEVGDGRPRAVITGSDKVVEGRPLAQSLSANNSYSPLKYKINHSLDVWTNYANVYYTPGDVNVTLQVTDDHGQVSDVATHNIKVLPDLPPTIGLQYVDKAVRNIQVALKNTSYSPDGDTIVSNTISYQYDANNNGVYGDSGGEGSVGLSFDGSSQAYFNPSKVGKYKFHVCAVEDWGRSSCSDYVIDVINESPTSIFTTSSTLTEPVPPASSVSISPSTFMGGSWVSTNFSNSNLAKTWYVDSDGTLVSPNLLRTYPYRGGVNFSNAYQDGSSVYGIGFRESNKDYYGSSYTAVPEYDSDGYETGNYFVEKKDKYGTYQWDDSGASSTYDDYTKVLTSKDNSEVWVGRWAFFSKLDIFNNSTGAYLRSDYNSSLVLGGYNDFAIVSESGSRLTAYKTGGSFYSWTKYGVSGNGAYGLALSNDGYIYSADSNNIYVLDANNGQQLSSYAYHGADGSTYYPSQMHLIDDNKLVFCYSYDDAYGDNWGPVCPTYIVTGGTGNRDLDTYYMLYSPSGPSLSDLEINYKMRLPNKYGIESSGFAFKVQDTRNMLRVEADGSNVRLVRISNGTRTVLQEVPYAMSLNVDYTFKIKSVGNNHKVYINGVPYIDYNEYSFGSGRLGPFSEIPGTKFSGVSYTDLSSLAPPSVTLHDVVQIGHSITYSETYMDGEGDPRIPSQDEWYYEHLDQKFIDTGDGYSGWSAYNGWKPYGWTINSFDKVGLYRITLRTLDDPNLSYPWGDMTFNNYRAWSTSYSRTLIVFRPPIAQFTAWLNGDGTIHWNDTSYDPDRCYPNGGWCQPPDTTGIDYTQTRGIMDRKYYAKAPSGLVTSGKLISCSESGTYELGLAVKNEYGAWSNWATYNITCNPTTPHAKPTASMTTFGGSKATAWNYVKGTELWATWYQYNGSGDVFTGYNLEVLDEWGNLVWGTGYKPQWNVNGTNVGATITAAGIPGNQWYQVRVKVSTDYAESDWSSPTWIYYDTLPTVTITSPIGTTGSPALLSTTRPTITWKQIDDNPATIFRGRHLRIYNSSGGLIYDWALPDTASTSDKFQIPLDLSGNTLYRVTVQINDGIYTSNEAEQWFKINRPPVATMYSIPTPSKNLTPTLTFNQSDPDAGTTFWGYHLYIDTDGVSGNIFDSGVVNESVGSGNVSFTVPVGVLQANKTYRAYVFIADGITWSAKSNIITFETYSNNIPSAQIVFPDSPDQAKPQVINYENPTIKINQTDPDANDIFTKYRVVFYYTDNWTVAYDTGEVAENTRDTALNVYVPVWLDKGRTIRVQAEVADGDGEWSALAWTSGFKYFVINNPPGITLTDPNTPCSSPKLYVDENPTIAWTQSSWNPKVAFTKFRTQILDLANNIWFDSGEVDQSNGTNASWKIPKQIIPDQTLQVRVMTKDNYDWSTWSNVGCFIYTDKPTADVFNPNGSPAAPTIIMNTLRPAFSWHQNDPDPGTVFSGYRVQILNENGVSDPNNPANVVMDSSYLSQNSTSTTQSWTANADLAYENLYGVRVMVSDGKTWSDWSNAKWFKLRLNTPPAASLTYPNGTQASPSVTGTQNPTITWTQTDADIGTAFKAFQIQVMDTSGGIVYDSDQVAQDTESADGSFTVPSALPRGQLLGVQVRVYDGMAWSNWSTEYWMMINRPPMAAFNWSPNPVFVGDTLTLTNQSTDPDSDPMTTSWSITDPNGTTTVQSTSNATISNVLFGNYNVTLTQTDVWGTSNSLIQTVSVLQLTVDGAVHHTTEWETNRISYNAANPSSPRSADTYWAGEKFMFTSSVTNTGTATQATNVNATLVEKGITVPLTSSDNINWSGSMWQNDFDTLMDGTYTFRFRATWNSGYINSYDVQVQIKDSVWDVTRTHRIQ